MACITNCCTLRALHGTRLALTGARLLASLLPSGQQTDMNDRRLEIATSIRHRIMSGLHLGRLEPGARLPSTREIAEEFEVAPRTVMAAYRILEAEGLVELRQRSGIYVALGRNTGVLLTQLAGWVTDVLLQARARDVAPIAFPERVRRCLETLRLRAACVAGNADQLDQICHELNDDYGIASEPLAPDQLARPGSDAQRVMARADLFVCTAAHAVETHWMAQRLGKTALTVTLRAELMAEITRQLARGPVYFVGTDPHFRDALALIFAPTGYGHHVRPIILREDDPDTIPDDAPTLVMRRAHEQLGDAPLARRVHPVRRVFSDAMARALLRFVIQANMAAMAARSETP